MPQPQEIDLTGGDPGVPSPQVSPLDQGFRTLRLSRLPSPKLRAQTSLGICLLFIFAATIALGFAAPAAHWMAANDDRSLLQLLIPAQVGLLGAVTGFFYGKQVASGAVEGTDTSE